MSVHKRLYDTEADAHSVIERLRAIGISEDSISWVASRKDKPEGEAIGTAAAGTGIGALLGGGAGALASAGLIAIPGLGPVVAAGWFAATLTGALAGAVAGGVTGGIAQAIMSSDKSVNAADAEIYAEGIRQGGVYLTVRVPDEFDARVISALDQTPTPTVAERGQRYRSEGWKGVDPTSSATWVTEAERQRSA